MHRLLRGSRVAARPVGHKFWRAAFVAPWAMVAAAVIALAGGASAAETHVDNPYYPSWAKFHGGGVMIVKRITHLLDRDEVVTIRYIVTAVEEKAVRLEHRYFAADGQEINDLRTNAPIWKRLPLDEGYGKDPLAPDPKYTLVGVEKVQVGGKTYDARKYQKPETVFGSERMNYVWLTPAVPGLRVKSQVDEKFAGKWQKAETVEFVEIQPAP